MANFEPVRYLKGDKIFDGKSFLPVDSVLVYDHQNLLIDTVPLADTEPGMVEFFEGILCPGFINTHCHLELSHLRGQIPKGTGLPGFAQHIMTLRDAFRQEERLEAMYAADEEMEKNGIVAVGDICNTNESISVKSRSNVFYHSFVELIALDPQNARKVFEKGNTLVAEYRDKNLSAGLTPHAPYSVSLSLIELISKACAAQQLPFSIHNQESLAEDEFFREGSGALNELYDFLKLDTSYFKPSGKSSLATYAHLLTKDPILVHNTFSDAADLSLPGLQEAFWCFCPAANLYIEKSLPDFSMFLNKGLRFCFGTDSLASNNRLDLLQEANIFMDNVSGCSSGLLLAALTSVPAAALHIDDRYGSLKRGTKAGLNQIADTKGKLKFIKKILAS